MNDRRIDTVLSRSQQIAEVLARHGLGYLVGILGLERFVPFHRGLLGHPRRAQPYTRPEHVRMALEELGATFIKLGQLLSTRTDLLPPEYQVELATLQDAAPPIAWEIIEATLAMELGQPLEACFGTFESAPLAAASIGQAHAATLLDGTEVVVKIRRPGVVEQIEQDLTILHDLSVAASRRWERADQYDLVALAEEFAQTLRAEVDHIREGQSAERFAANFAGDAAVHIPRVVWETTTSRILTLERIRGMKVNDVGALDAARIDRSALAERAAKVILKMVFEDGFYHADPHPGNLFIEPDGRIGIIDFGMVGIVNPDTQEQLTQVILAVTSADTNQLVDAIIDLGIARGRLERAPLRRDLEQLFTQYSGKGLGEIAIGPLLQSVLAIVRHHHLQLPANLTMLIKTIIMNEGMGAQLDPDFHLASVLAPYAEQLILEQLAPSRVVRRLSQASMGMVQLGVALPQQMRRILGDLERGNLVVGLSPEGFEPLMFRFEQLANRIVLGIIAAAFIVGLAVLLAIYHPPGVTQWAGLLFAIGFVMATALGVYLAWIIIRSAPHQ